MGLWYRWLPPGSKFPPFQLNGRQLPEIEITPCIHLTCNKNFITNNFNFICTLLLQYTNLVHDTITKLTKIFAKKCT